VTIHLPPCASAVRTSRFLAELVPGNTSRPDATQSVSSTAMKALLAYDWPGNVRELENCLERAVALGASNSFDLGDLPSSHRSSRRSGEGCRFEMSASGNPTTDLEDIERATIQRVFVQGERRQGAGGEDGWGSESGLRFTGS